MSPIADQVVLSLILWRLHIVEIDHEIFSTVILLLLLFHELQAIWHIVSSLAQKLNNVDFSMAKLRKIGIFKTFHQNKICSLRFFYVYICLGYNHIIFMENLEKNITILGLINSLVKGYVQNLFVLIVTGQGN